MSERDFKQLERATEQKKIVLFALIPNKKQQEIVKKLLAEIIEAELLLEAECNQ